MVISDATLAIINEDMPKLQVLLEKLGVSQENQNELADIISQQLEESCDSMSGQMIASYLSAVCLTAYFQGFDNDIDLGTRGTVMDVGGTEVMEEDEFGDFEEDAGEIIDDFSMEDDDFDFSEDEGEIIDEVFTTDDFLGGA